MSPVNPKLALALGGGAARGWAHIGVMRALEEAGIRPHHLRHLDRCIGGCSLCRWRPDAL